MSFENPLSGKQIEEGSAMLVLMSAIYGIEILTKNERTNLQKKPPNR